ncbi:hypothetical protein M0812_06512 [Anaeramoeba flamelloides]|uniref:Uncharacterized protein n=1 Tax=Anaeramoeba flamelloides TaxID=1746091 RepID=A0AAV8AEJ8_9EUKA|nr:hypothetical protein M0812_06512 [Anaeramoeba flamelloides]|eukprot:Anaeramoba_flamelloidesa570205_193.p1 GENE.a570205_193~~a570205_193.p1  ORF type:complete len:233 (-),score=49.38 a570205_193:117-782(-)
MTTQLEDPNYKLQLCLALLNLGTRNYLNTSLNGSIKKYPNAHNKYCTSNFENLCLQANLHLQQTKTNQKCVCPQTESNDQKKRHFPKETISEKKLSDFLNQKPKPSWSVRIEMLYLYKPNLLLGWKKGLSNHLKRGDHQLKPPKIIIDKHLLGKVAKLSCKTTCTKEYTKFYKSTSRGIEEYLKRYGYNRQTKYERKKLVFVLSIKESVKDVLKKCDQKRF